MNTETTTAPTIVTSTTAPYRKCRKCGKILPITDLAPNARCRGGYQPTCKKCKSESHSIKTVSGNSLDVNLDTLSNDVLICEIRKRGFKGELKYSQVITL